MKMQRENHDLEIIEAREINFEEYKNFRSNFEMKQPSYNTRIFDPEDGTLIFVHLDSDDIFDIAEDAYEDQQEAMCCFDYDEQTDPDEVGYESI